MVTNWHRTGDLQYRRHVLRPQWHLHCPRGAWLLRQLIGSHKMLNKLYAPRWQLLLASRCEPSLSLLETPLSSPSGPFGSMPMRLKFGFFVLLLSLFVIAPYYKTAISVSSRFHCKLGFIQFNLYYFFYRYALIE